MTTNGIRQHDSRTVPLGRRNWLKVTAGILIGSPTMGALCPLAAAAEDWRAKARQNVKLGIMSNTYSHLPLEQAVAKIKAEGFGSVVTDYVFSDVRFNPLAPDWRAAAKIRGSFDRQGIRIVGLFGYTNIVDPLPDRRKHGMAKIEFLLANWKRLGCANVSTETGTLNPQSDSLADRAGAREGPESGGGGDRPAGRRAGRARLPAVPQAPGGTRSRNGPHH